MTRLLAIAAVAVAGIAGAVYWNSLRTELPGIAAVSAQEAKDVDTSKVLEMTMGNPDASVTVVEYASFTCPHCRNFHEGAFKDLKSDYIDTDKIHFVYREVYFDRFGLWAGMVARCGGEGRYFGIVDLLYEGQREWVGDGQDPAAIAGRLKTIGKTAGLSQEQVDACLTDGDMAQAMVAVYQQNAEADNVRSTPSFIINGESVSGNSYEDLKAVIDRELGS